jgi:putative SOS response-associated peptidase YedK
MCNEFSFTQPLDRLIEIFGALGLPIHWASGAPNLEPRESIRPTEPTPVLLASPEGPELKQLRWGFPRDRGGPLINFRSDGRRFPVGRCLIPMDGFYEFTGAKAPKAKWLFTAADGDVFGVAGLVRDDRFTLLTTEPGPDIAPYHDRQIAILPRPQWSAWLDPSADQPAIAPLAAGSLAVRQVRQGAAESSGARRPRRASESPNLNQSLFGPDD